MEDFTTEDHKAAAKVVVEIELMITGPFETNLMIGQRAVTGSKDVCSLLHYSL
jgi:hypothetical protein